MAIFIRRDRKGLASRSANLRLPVGHKRERLVGYGRQGQYRSIRKKMGPEARWWWDERVWRVTNRFWG